jgi:glutathione S-transferase
MIEHLKLFHSPATRSARVRWLLAELELPCELVPVNLMAGEQYDPAFLALNPNHSVPVLQISRSDGSVQTLVDSGGILAFLADAYPEKGLLPPPGDSPARAEALQMLHFGAGWMDMMLWQIRLHGQLLPPEQSDPRTAERLAVRAHIAGEAFSVADCVIGHNLLWARSSGLCTGRVFGLYLARLSRRPAFALAFEDAGSVNRNPSPAGVVTERLNG